MNFYGFCEYSLINFNEIQEKFNELIFFFKTSSGLALNYSEKLKHNPMTLDDLIDLRNRLMLNKIPDELDIDDIPTLIQIILIN